MLLFADSRAAVRAGVPGHGRHRDGGPGHRNHRQHQVCQVSSQPPAAVWGKSRLSQHWFWYFRKDFLKYRCLNWIISWIEWADAWCGEGSRDRNRGQVPIVAAFSAALWELIRTRAHHPHQIGSYFYHLVKTLSPGTQDKLRPSQGCN